MLTLREAHEGDLPQLTRWSYDFERDDGHPPDVDPGEPFLAETWREFRRNPARGEVLVIDEGATPVGYVVLASYWSNEFRGELTVLDELYLDRAHRGGRGPAVLDLITARLRARGCRALNLEVLNANPRVASLYERYGFRSDRRVFVLRLDQR